MTTEHERAAIIADSADYAKESAPAPEGARSGTGTENDGAPMYFTVAVAAGLLKVSERSIWRWIHGGRLAARKIGRQYRIRAETLKTFGEDIDEGRRREEQEEREELEQIALDTRIQEYGNED